MRFRQFTSVSESVRLSLSSDRVRFVCRLMISIGRSRLAVGGVCSGQARSRFVGWYRAWPGDFSLIVVGSDRFVSGVQTGSVFQADRLFVCCLLFCQLIDWHDRIGDFSLSVVVLGC